jgi:DNA polymerase-3 subunit delta'
MAVWDRLVGQARAIELLDRAARDAHQPDTKSNSMTHAWLFTGPPGAGRSTAAILFAAAILCENFGCGNCSVCRQVLNDQHPDVNRFIPQQITITRDEAEALIREASVMPLTGDYRIIVIEDADRLSEVSGNMLLKSIEEPHSRAVWILCTPSVDDVLPTIRSRCRTLALATPAWQEVSELLIKEGIEPAMAAYSARAAQGHVGRARGLATDEATRRRRHEILQIPSQLHDLRACFIAAENIVSVATEEANAESDRRDESEKADVLELFGAEAGSKSKGERAARPILRELETRQKSRRTRAVRDRLDQSLTDLMSYFTDVMKLQLIGDGAELVNEDLRGQIKDFAQNSTAAKTRARMEAIERARRQFASNAQPQMIIEALTIELARA